MSNSLIPQAFRDELLNRTDIVELIDSYVPLKKRGNSHLACCPFHNEKTPSFNVNGKKQFYHCFGCGANGNAISFLMNHLNQGFVDAIETLAARLGMSVPRNASRHTQENTSALYHLLEKINLFYQNKLKTAAPEAVSYLKGRGLNGDIARKYQIGFAPQGWNTLEHSFKHNVKELITTGMLIKKDDGKTCDRYRNRIMFPIHDRRGRITGFGGRAIGTEQKPKYLNSPETPLFQKSRELYGLYQILQQNQTVEYILIVEGYMDVIALAQFGIHEAVAALGTATSTWHIQTLMNHTRRIVFCFDGDTAGKKAAWKALETSLPHLEKGLDVRFMFLPDGHDPDSLVRAEGAEAFKARIQTATPLNQYLLETLTNDLDSQSAAGKSQLLNAASPYLNKMPEGGYKQILLDDLARLTRIENHRIEQILSHKKADAVVEKNPKQAIVRSPVRLAMALLLQNPEIFRICRHEIAPASLDGKGQEVLQKLLQQMTENPELNTASLIEAWRETEYFDSLLKLAAWDHLVPEEALSKEFSDIMRFLQKKNFEKKIGEYLAKSRKQGLTTAEQIVLQDMLKKRHSMIHNKT